MVVPSRWLAWLRPGHAFQAAIDETAKIYPARLARIGARIDGDAMPLVWWLFRRPLATVRQTLGF